MKVLSDFALKKTPTAVIGDFNWNYKESFKIKNFLEENDFIQAITEPTHEMGHILDHVYLSRTFPRGKVEVACSPAYFSDHDIVSLHLSLK